MEKHEKENLKDEFYILIEFFIHRQIRQIVNSDWFRPEISTWLRDRATRVCGTNNANDANGGANANHGNRNGGDGNRNRGDNVLNEIDARPLLTPEEDREDERARRREFAERMRSNERDGG